MVLVCLPLAAPIGLSLLHILTPCGSERVSVVSPCVTFRRVVASLRGQSPVLPFACCVESLRSVGRCSLSPAGVVSAFAEPAGWCAGAVLDVAWCAILCVSGAQ